MSAKTTYMRKLISLIACIFYCFICDAQSGLPSVYPLGANLTALSYYDKDRPFNDVMKTADGFTSVLSGGLTAPRLDSLGWPLQDFNITVMNGMDTTMGGTYKLKFNGSATVAKQFGGFTVSNQVYNPTTNTTTADLVFPVHLPANQSMGLTFTSTHFAPGVAGAKNIQIMKPGVAFDGPVFDSTFLNHFSRFACLRYIFWRNTIDNQDSLWENRTQITSPSQSQKNGCAWEYCIMLANTLHSDLWINVPFLADSTYIINLAQLIKDSLDPTLHVYIENSNEVWNFAYSETILNNSRALAEGSVPGSILNFDGINNPGFYPQRRHALRSKIISDLFKGVMGASSLNDRFRVMFGAQLAFFDNSRRGIDFINDYFGDPSQFFFGICGAPYFNATATNTDSTATDTAILNALQTAIDTKVYKPFGSQMDQYAARTKYYNIKLYGYEGGPDTYGPQNISAKRDANRNPRIKPMCYNFLRTWYTYGPDNLINWFTGGAGSWGTAFGTWTLTENYENSYKLQAIDSILHHTTVTDISAGLLIPGTVAMKRVAGADSNAIAGTSYNANGAFLPFNEWLLRLPRDSAGVYEFKIESATNNPGLKCLISVDNVIVDTLSIPNTHSTSSFTTSLVGHLFLTPGFHTMRVKYLGSGANHNNYRLRNLFVTRSTNHLPSFSRGASVNLSVCQNSAAVSINSILGINDSDILQGETWSVLTTATHGTLGGFNSIAAATIFTVSPGATTYVPIPSYSGTDSFRIKVSDGIGSDTIRVLVTISPTPFSGAITGAANVCLGANITFISDSSTGIWSSGNNGIATIGTSGIVTGISSGTVTISFTRTTGTCSSSSIQTIRSGILQPVITGLSQVCQGSSIALAADSLGGTWSITNSHASISSGGVVTGVTRGVDTIIYSYTNSCGTAISTKIVNSLVIPDAGSITGPSNLCNGITEAVMVDTVFGGQWVSANNKAFVTLAGHVTGLIPGSDTIYYILSNSCGIDSASKIINITAIASSGTISSPSNICVGATTLPLQDVVVRLQVTSPSTAAGDLINTVSNNGSGVSANWGGLPPTLNNVPLLLGSSSDSDGCSSFPTGFFAGKIALLWHNTICQDGFRALQAQNAGAIACIIINNTGGPTIMSTGSFGSSVNIPVFMISFTDGQNISSILNAGTSVATSISKDTIIGGIWSSRNTGIAQVGSLSGIVTGVAAGTSVITYTNGCGASATHIMTVTSSPAAITGNGILCLGANTTLADVTPGGTWTSNNTAIATIGSTSGLLSSVSTGTTIITYNTLPGCFATLAVNVIPVLPSITGPSSVCRGASATLSNSINGGTWISNNIAVASIGSASGIITGVNTGSTIITYIVAAGCQVTTTETIITVPVAGVISGSTTCIIGGTTTLSNSAAGGVWSSGNTSIAVIGISSGTISGSSIGTSQVTYTISNSCGVSPTSTIISVISAPLIFTIAGTGTAGSAGDGGTVSAAQVNGPIGTVMDAAGNLYIAEQDGNRVRKINIATGAISTIAGTGSAGYNGDDIAATAAMLNQPSGLAIDNSGNLLIADQTNNRIRKINAITGTITTIAGNGTATFSGDGSVATAASIRGPVAVALDVYGNIYISDTRNQRIRKISIATGIIKTIAGSSNSPSYGGDGGAATAALFSNPRGIAVDISGNVFITDRVNQRIRKVDASTGIVTTIAGNGSTGFSGDGIAATSTTLTNPTSINIDDSGNIIVADFGNNRIRSINSAGIISTIAGLGTSGFSGDGGLATLGKLNGPSAVWMVNSNNFYISDQTNNRIRYVGVLPPNSGTTTLCPGAATTLTNSTTGGTWSSNNIAIATIGSLTGTVTGISSGQVVISYSFNGGITTTLISISPVPQITGGNSGVCLGGSVALVDSVVGGVWSSSNTGVVTIGTASGVATGISAGTAVISYRTPAGCLITRSLQINPLPSPISGPANICFGAIGSLNDSVVGGVWTSADTTIASVAPSSGLITGIAPGITNITYTLPTGCFTIESLTVNPVAPITGISEICAGTSVSFNDTLTGGIWSSSNSNASAGSISGNIAGINAGTSTISYLLPTGCLSTTIIVIKPVGVITGGTSFCLGQSDSLSNNIPGGLWTTSDSTVAGIDSLSGLLNNLSPGTTNITYSQLNGCSASITVTVNAFSPITGNPLVCQGETVNLTDAENGGVWSSSNTAIAAIDTSGNITGVASGVAMISYLLNTGCLATFSFSVSPVAPITGATNLCNASTTLLTNPVTGGTWLSDDSTIANIGSVSGLATGINPGIAHINYILASGCASSITITVNPVTAITGANTVCQGTVTTLGNAEPGGTWSSSNVLTGSVSTSGNVTGITAGTVTISYLLGTGCLSTISVMVNPRAAITGSTNICNGSNATLSNVVTGGIWSSTNPGVALIDSISGVITGIAPGTAIITYLTLTGCSSVTTITINPFSPISAASNVCQGQSATFTNLVTGGTWSSSNTVIATIGSGSGILTGITAGTAMVSYALPTGCIATFAITINGLAPITGATSVCLGLGTTLGNAIPGGTWSTHEATVTVGSSTGFVSGIASGTAIVSYTTAAGCIAATVININPVAAINGPSKVCVAQTITLDNPLLGGTWTSGNIAIATVGSASGIVTGISGSSAGISVTITYSLGTGCRSFKTVSVNTITSITGPAVVCPGQNIRLNETTPGGIWSTSDLTGTVGSTTGLVTGVTSGSLVISYTVSTGCIVTKSISVNPLPSSITGSTSLCSTTSVTLSDVTGGGTWSSSATGIASIGFTSGVVNGIVSGIAVITYTVGTCTATTIVTVNPMPANITGLTSVCLGATTALNNTTTGGIWSSSNTGVASVNPTTGLITGLAAGTANITYSLGACFKTAPMSIFISVSPISGSTNGCIGQNTTFSNSSPGGIWSSSNIGIAVIGSVNGVLTGVSSGTTIISYTLPCGVSTSIVTVRAVPPSITGTLSICQGATTTLSDAVTGGFWTSSNLAVASINSSTGLMTGVSGGTAVITYTALTGCSTSVIASVNASSITGASIICVGTNALLSSTTVPGGLWSSSNTLNASVNCNLGIVNGLLTGTSIITYSFGAGCIATSVITVVSPSANTGLPSLCVGAATTLSNTTTGGVWTSSNVAAAIVGSNTGIVTGLASGNTTISYVFSTGCTVNTDVIVMSLAPNTGSTNVCPGLTKTLANSTIGGTWSSSNAAIATVNATTGVVTGVFAGSTLISYSFGSNCIVTSTMNVNPVPLSVLVTGGGTYCGSDTITASGGSGETIYFEGTTSGGLSNATPSASEVVTSSGTYYFRAKSAVGCWGAEGSTTVLIPSISGPLTICQGTTTNLTNTGGTGTWASSNTSIATIGSSTGLVTGILPGNTVINLTIGTGCVVTTTVNIVTSAPAITGISGVCAGQTITLADSGIGGTWSSGSPTIATVGLTTGVVTGLASGAGSAIITYSLSTGCRSTKTITVNALSVISGPTSVCSGQTINLTDAATGGIWGGSLTGIVTVGSSSGIVTGNLAGTAIISYTMPTGCLATSPIQVVVMSPITGFTSVCAGQFITLSNATGGGIWSATSPTIASIGSATGVVTGVAGGLSTGITYTLGSGCRTITTVSVNSLSPITGPSGVCQGSTISLFDPVPGGTWSSGSIIIASIGSTGILTGLSAGIVNVTYSLPSGCKSIVPIFVNPVAPISGPATVCQGQTISLSNTAGAGTWSSSLPTVASIGDATGIVTGIAQGLSTNITYTFCTGCTAVTSILVNSLSPISGSASVCQGQTITMTDAAIGGTWSSSLPGLAIIGSTSGIVTGTGVGTPVISYRMPTGCTATTTITVNSLAPIGGTPGVCVGKTTQLNNIIPGGTWTSSTPTIASIGSTGLVAGIAGGLITTISYALSNGCRTTIMVSVNSNPAIPAAISGPASVSMSGAPITLTDATTGGAWSSSNTSRAIIAPSTGAVTGVGLGTVIITYTVANGAGCTNFVNKNITVGAVPPPHSITTKTVSINVDGSLVLNESIKGGMWSCDDCEGVISLNTETGVITGIATGRATITYTVNDEFGTSLTITKVIVNALPESVIILTKEGNVYLIPNPNKGEFTVKGNLATTIDEDITIEIVDILGQSIYKGNAIAIEGKINEQVVLSNTLANGMYLLNLHSNAEHYEFHFVIER